MAGQFFTFPIISVSSSPSGPIFVSDLADGPVTPGTVAAKSELVGFQFNTTLPTLTNGQQAAAQADSRGRLIISPLLNTSVVKAQLEDDSGAAITLGQKLMASSVPVVLASDQSTIAISSLQLPAALGQTVMASSLAVTIASNQSALAVSQSGNWSSRTQDGAGVAITSETVNSATGLSVADVGFVKANTPVYNDYTGTSITTAAYVTLIASTSATTREIEIFDSSGQALYLAVGAAASEVNQMIIYPGGNGRVKLSIPAASRVSAKAITANATVGFLVINLYG